MKSSKCKKLNSFDVGMMEQQKSYLLRISDKLDGLEVDLTLSYAEESSFSADIIANSLASHVTGNGLASHSASHLANDPICRVGATDGK